MCRDRVCKLYADCPGAYPGDAKGRLTVLVKCLQSPAVLEVGLLLCFLFLLTRAFWKCVIAPDLQSKKNLVAYKRGDSRQIAQTARSGYTSRCELLSKARPLPVKQGCQLLYASFVSGVAPVPTSQPQVLLWGPVD